MTEAPLKALIAQWREAHRICISDGGFDHQYFDEYKECADELEALLSVSPQENGSEWQDISTAPQGAMMLVCSMKATVARKWCFVDWLVGGVLCEHPHWTATHWMPLPAPPVIAEHDKSKR